LLKRKKLKVFFSDNYNLTLKKNLNQKKLISKSDIIIIGVPHKVYKTIKIPKNKYLIDIWGFIEK
jgi:hypothetical protein